MTADNGTPQEETLRQQAEKRVRGMAEQARQRHGDDPQRLLEELQVHHIELEIQNEELRCTRYELEETSRRYADLYQNAPVGYLTLDSEGVVLEANSTAARLLEMARQELAGSPFSALVQLEDQRLFFTHLRQVIRQRRPAACETRMLRESPSLFLRLESIPVQEANRTLCRTTLHDVTSRRQSEEALRRTHAALENSRARYAELHDTAPVGLLTLDSSGLVLEANSTLAVMLGVGLPPGTRFDERVVPEDRAAFQHFLAQGCRHTRSRAVEIQLRHRDDSRLDARLECLAACLEDKREHRLSVADLTVHKQLEYEQMQAQKLESLGVLAGGIAHDFNNLLTAILGNISLARIYVGEDQRAVAKMAMAEQASLRARDLTQQLLAFARGGEPMKKPVALADLIRKTAGLILHSAQCQMETDLPPELWPVEADPVQLGQVLQNLLINSVQAMPEGGVIEVRAANLELAKDNLQILPPGRYVRIAIQDQGPGVPPEIREKIFDPYFSTKEKSSGLGLAVSLAIVARHGGRLLLEPDGQQGALFALYLPAAAETAIVPEEIEAGEPIILPGHGRILVMDDEESVREVATGLLRYLGYEVTEARHGQAALDLYQEAMDEGRPYQAVLLDLVVPEGMGGEEALRRLREMDPGVKAIVSSGYSNSAAARKYQAYGFLASLPKPYNLTQLSRVLHEVLGRVISK